MTMNLIDTHAHLYWDKFRPDLEAVIKRAKEAGVEYVINIGTDVTTSSTAAELENPEVKFYSTIGIHPEEALRFASFAQGKPAFSESIHQNIEELEKIYQSNPQKVVGIGECGLDFAFNPNFNSTPLSDIEKGRQKELFSAQIALAKKLNLPVIIHCRDAWDQIFLPELSGTRGVFHHFSSTQKDAQKALDLGYYLSFSCVVTYPKNQLLREIIKNTPLSKILTETDCPFLPPQTMRGQRNEPANVVEVVKVIAEVKGLSYEKVAKTTLQNAQTLFSFL